MEYKVTKVVEEIDVLSVSQAEYDRLNEFYKEIISKRFPRLARDNQIYDVRRIVMTDDLSRIEVVVAVEGKEPDRVRTPQTDNN
jgi:hypothetical protein